VKQPVVYILASKPYGTLYVGDVPEFVERMS
jgi:predicted GIY-YIG superfamily endonuclease